jgi:hypothetical protein
MKPRPGASLRERDAQVIANVAPALLAFEPDRRARRHNGFVADADVAPFMMW